MDKELICQSCANDEFTLEKIDGIWWAICTKCLTWHELE